MYVTRIYILSDGDLELTDGPGELDFRFETCPDGAMSFAHLSNLTWTEGRHPTSVRLTSTSGNTPDQLRIVPWSYEDDDDELTSRNKRPDFQCDLQRVVDPGSSDTGNWNSLVMDFDLTKYPGAKAAGTFVRRSKPLANGSTLAFEIRGSFLITRQ